MYALLLPAWRCRSRPSCVRPVAVPLDYAPGWLAGGGQTALALLRAVPLPPHPDPHPHPHTMYSNTRTLSIYTLALGRVVYLTSPHGVVYLIEPLLRCPLPSPPHPPGR